MNDRETVSYDRLLDYLRRIRGTDFSTYKQGSVQRRVAKRIDALELAGPDEYMDYLEVHPDEFQNLFDTLLINVTSFFRDPKTWDHIAHEIVPKIVESSEGRSIRIWVPGCATGEEAYTIAMLFASAMNEDNFRSRVKIFATDLDEAALALARHGAYSQKALETVPEDLRERFMSQTSNGTAVFKSDLRHNLIFGPHDLTRDPPIRNADLISCRNTLMYFNGEMQGAIALRFHFALRPTGYLLLGRAEGLFSHGDLFRPVSMEHRIFVRVQMTMSDRLLRLARPAYDEPQLMGPEALVTESAFDALPNAVLVIDSEGLVVAANQRARSLFDISQGDIGRPLYELEVSYRPVELRSMIESCQMQRETVRAEATIEQIDGREMHLEVIVVPLLGVGRTLGTEIMFHDVTGQREVESESVRSKHALEAANEELQSTNEELETTNEELQSTVEELETTNEELQSTNEELETMNEELQSTNEELQTLNDELRERTLELHDMNAFLESVMSGLEFAMLVVDRVGVVLSWNSKSEELWGLRSHEVVGQSLFMLDIGLPVSALRQPLDAVTDGDTPESIELEGRTRRGVRCVVEASFSPLHRSNGTIRGAIIKIEIARMLD